MSERLATLLVALALSGCATAPPASISIRRENIGAILRQQHQHQRMRSEKYAGSTADDQVHRLPRPPRALWDL
jgi:hypothetical protein